jgi:hypothetical protein
MVIGKMTQPQKTLYRSGSWGEGHMWFIDWHCGLEGAVELSKAEQDRLQRLQRTRSRAPAKKPRKTKRPSRVPTDLARTSAFAPRVVNLAAADFEQVYVVEGGSVIEVRGRELGSQHRDALYALFRLPTRNVKMTSQDGRTETVFESQVRWGDIVEAQGLSRHVNNLLTVLRVLEDIKSVNIRVYEGTVEDYEKARENRLLAGKGFSENLLTRIDWDGVSLDSRVTVRYGEWVRKMFSARNICQISEAYFRLSSDYAKSIWPYIDSYPVMEHLDEEIIGCLVHCDVVGENYERRGKFRQTCKNAFDDMIRAGCIESYRITEVKGPGRMRLRRYWFVTAQPKQGCLPL